MYFDHCNSLYHIINALVYTLIYFVNNYKADNYNNLYWCNMALLKFSLSPPSLPPSDVDECLITNGGCSQGCVNTVGSFYCTCLFGYTLQADGRTCVNECKQAKSSIIITFIFYLIIIVECTPVILGCQQSCTLDQCSCNPGYIVSSSDSTRCEGS